MAAKPTTDQLQPLDIALESTTLTLADVFTKLKGNSSDADAQQLLQDIPVLQEWQRATRPSHEVRDAMLKLASNWNVKHRAEGKKRSPSEVAKDMEENMLKRAKLVLTSYVSKPDTQSDNHFDGPATQTMPSSSSDPNPTTDQLQSVDIPTNQSSNSAGRLAMNQLHSQPIASESMTLTLSDLLSRLQGNSSQTDAQ